MKKVPRKKGRTPKGETAARAYFKKKVAELQRKDQAHPSGWASPRPKDLRGRVAIDGLNQVLHPRGKQTPWMRGLDPVQKRVDTEQ